MGDRDDWKWAVGETAAALTLVFGGAQWAFYGRLGIRPDDIGLGTDEVLVQAAVGSAGLLASAGLLGGLALVTSLWLLATFESWTSAFRWTELLVGLPVVGAWAGYLWWDLPFRLALTALIASTAAYAWTTRRPREGLEQAPWQTATMGALLWTAGLPLGTLVATLVRGRFDLSDTRLVLLVTTILLAVFLMLVTHVPRMRIWLGRQDTQLAWKGMLALAAGLVALTTSVAVVNHSDLVRSGGTLTSLEQRLVGAPVRCVEPRWVGTGESPLPANTKHLLFLGTGDQTVLYQPKRGPVSVPAGDVVLLPAAPSRCRP